MPRKSINSNEEIQKLRDALAHSETERLKLNEQYTEIKKQLQASLEGNKTLLNLLVELQTKLDIVLVQTKKRNKKEFGAKTENHNPRHSSGANLDDDDIVEPSKEDQDSPTEIVKEKVKRNHKKHIHDDSNLPKKIVPHKVSHDKSKCPTCSIDTKFVRNELTYQLERIVHTVEKLEHQQEVRSCPKCKTYIVTAEKPDAPFPGALCGPGLLASVIVDKIADGLPNYRQAKRFKRSAHTIPRSTQSDWSLAGAATLAPLYKLAKEAVLNSDIIKTDDTELKIQDRTRKSGIRKGKMTTYLGDAKFPLNLFDFSPDKSFARNNLMLSDFHGIVQCDAAGGFDQLFLDGTKKEAGCNAHSRRHFFDAQVVAESECKFILDLYQEIYKIEKRLKDKKEDEISLVRLTETTPLLMRLKTKLDSLKDTLPPSHPLMKAVNYSLNHWIALSFFAQDPRLNIDNNETERAIKEFVLARKNFLFVGSDSGGRAMAVHLTFVHSCTRNNIDPVEYLTDVFSRINSMKLSELQQLLPHNWRPLPTAS